MFTVYCHINKINGKRYVGITGRDVRKRWLNGKGYQGNIHFNNAIINMGGIISSIKSLPKILQRQKPKKWK